MAGAGHIVVAGHPLAAQAAHDLLVAGGNAVDAGVAAAMVLGVVRSYVVNFAGIAPMAVRRPDGAVAMFSGVGPWPRGVPPDHFRRRHDGAIPEGIERTLVPGAPAAFVAALRDFGTLRFADVAAAAIRAARDGFVMYDLMAGRVASLAERYRRWPANAAIWLPDGAPPPPGATFRQPGLAAVLQHLADSERGPDRAAALEAVHRAFYSGDIAAAAVRHHRQAGGFLAAEDLALFRQRPQPALACRFRDLTLLTGGPWCQGPMLPMVLNLLDTPDLDEVAQRDPGLLAHRLVESVKLAWADRLAWFPVMMRQGAGIEALLRPDYLAKRRALLRDDVAHPGLPPAGAGAALPAMGKPAVAAQAAADTSFVGVIDRWGGAFSCTPSDSTYDGPAIPELGLVFSTRGAQSWGDPDDPGAMAPGQAPVVTPAPALAMADDGRLLVFGTPGGDVQVQALAQCLLRRRILGESPAAAVAAPRYASYSGPDSFAPHAAAPGLVRIECRAASAVAAGLTARGHRVESWPDYAWPAGAVGWLERAPDGALLGGADPRQTCSLIAV